jgi:hypothetical protein
VCPCHGRWPGTGSGPVLGSQPGVFFAPALMAINFSRPPPNSRTAVMRRGPACLQTPYKPIGMGRPQGSSAARCPALSLVLRAWHHPSPGNCCWHRFARVGLDSAIARRHPKRDLGKPKHRSLQCQTLVLRLSGLRSNPIGGHGRQAMRISDPSAGFKVTRSYGRRVRLLRQYPWRQRPS